MLNLLWICFFSYSNSVTQSIYWICNVFLILMWSPRISFGYAMIYLLPNSSPWEYLCVCNNFDCNGYHLLLPSASSPGEDKKEKRGEKNNQKKNRVPPNKGFRDVRIRNPSGRVEGVPSSRRQQCRWFLRTNHEKKDWEGRDGQKENKTLNRVSTGLSREGSKQKITNQNAEINCGEFLVEASDTRNAQTEKSDHEKETKRTAFPPSPEREKTRKKTNNTMT